MVRSVDHCGPLSPPSHLGRPLSPPARPKLEQPGRGGRRL